MWNLSLAESKKTLLEPGPWLRKLRLCCCDTSKILTYYFFPVMILVNNFTKREVQLTQIFTVSIRMLIQFKSINMPIKHICYENSKLGYLACVNM